MAEPADSVNRALRQLPRWPWYSWAGVAAGAVALWAIVAGSAGPKGAPLPPGGSERGPMPTIKLGSEGSAVSVWQKHLGVPVTGKFDAATQAATVAWQQAQGLGADGVVGPKSWTAAGWPTPAGGGAPGGGGQRYEGPDFVGATPVPDSGGFNLSNDVAQRQAQIEGAILDGNYDHEWWPLVVTCKGHSGTFFVSRRELALAYGDARLTVNADFRTAQAIADMLPGGAYLLTSKLADEIQRQADKQIQGQSRNWQGTGTDNSGSTTKRMVQFSDEVEALVGGDPGLVALASKVWVNTPLYWTNPNTPEGQLSSRRNGANHGIYSFKGGKPVERAPALTGSSPGGLAVIQDRGMAHDKGHTDYSQLLRFVKAQCTVDGVTMDVADVARDPELSCLVSDEGVIASMKHPTLEGAVA